VPAHRWISWDILFDPKYVSKLKGCGVSVLDQANDVFAVALHHLGKDQNSKNPADYQAAFELLKKIRPTSPSSIFRLHQ
jgi:putrescine transport system substrate-binding protein